MADSSYSRGRAAGISSVTSPHQGLGAAYAVSLPLFEGPLDLLLHLIEQEQLDINEISLVAVTDQYLKTIDALEELAPGALADFLVVASRLLYIKSARLLPKAPSGEGEEEETSDTLVRHLLEYRQFKRAASGLRSREDDGSRLFVRPATTVDLGALTPKEPEFGELDVNLLQKALRKALQRIPVAPPLPQVKPYTVTVAERIVSVRVLLKHARHEGDAARQLSFSGLLEGSRSRIEIIVTFLAVLELVKQREVVAHQDATFGEIMLMVADDAALVQVDETSLDESSLDDDEERARDGPDLLSPSSQPEQ
jgi:segregation and condensation protein A